MKTKLSLKILLLVAILIIIMCLFTTNMVQATENIQNETETTKNIELTEEVIKLIPNTMTLKEKEVEWNDIKYYDEIVTPIRTILTNAGVNLSNCSMDAHRNSNIDIHKCTIFFHTDKVDFSKDITLKFSNSDKYNVEDEKIVKEVADNLDYVTDYISFDAKEPNIEEITNTLITNKINEQIKDKGIKCVITDNINASFSWFHCSTNINVSFFKNDICYASKKVTYSVVRELIIPENIRDTEEDYINYALPKIQEELKNKQGYISELLFDDSNLSEWHDMISKTSNLYNLIIDNQIEVPIRMAKKNTLKIEDGITIPTNANVTISAKTIDNASTLYKEMQNKLKENGYTAILNAYELKVTSGNLGKGLEITFDIGTENDGKIAMVLHQKKDGKYEEFKDIIVENGKVKINVTELSPFMVALKETKVENTTTTTTVTTDKKLDDEPKTGIQDYTVFAGIIALISLGGIVVLKYKKP